VGEEHALVVNSYVTIVLVNSSIKAAWRIGVDEPHINKILLRWAMKQKKGNHEKSRSLSFPKHLKTFAARKGGLPQGASKPQTR
jgi:hypothetical protein